MSQNWFYDALNQIIIVWIVSTIVSDLGWIDSNYFESHHSWIESNLPESYHEIFLTCFVSIQIILNRINLHPGIYESIQTLLDTYQSSLSPALSFSGLNQFIHLLNRFTQLFLDEKLHLLSFSVYTHSLITPKTLNHLHIFPLGLQNSLFIHSSRLNTFS